MRRQITISLQSLPTGILSKVVVWTIMLPFILALTSFILLSLVFVIPGLFLFARLVSVFDDSPDSHFDVGDTTVPTFYYTSTNGSEGPGYATALFFCMPVVGVVFGGIHCVGWFYNFPSSVEAMLWRVSSVVLTGIAFLLPISLVGALLSSMKIYHRQPDFSVASFSIILLVYVLSRLFLLVEAFISLRRLSPGMLALVKWTSFIPHI